MRITSVLLGMSFVACTTTTQPAPKSYGEHLADANAHDQRALAHEGAIERHGKKHLRDYRCGDVVLQDQASSGGEPLVLATPCWDPDEESAQTHARAAEHQRAAAREERRAARQLVETELAACRNIPEQERGHSPFAHRGAIVEVGAHYHGGAVRGARVTFRRIPGLSEEFLRQDIACNQARFETLGEASTYLPEDPTLVPGAEVTITGDATTISICIEVASDEAAQVVLARARALIAPPVTASR